MHSVVEPDGTLREGVSPDWVVNPLPMPFDQLFSHLKNLGMVKLENASDIGHVTFSPQLAMMKRLLEGRLRQFAAEYCAAAEIETPLLYRTSAQGVREEAGRFFGEMYHAGSESENSMFVIRPGGDFGAFNFFKSQFISSKDLPIRVFEIGPVMRRLRRSAVKNLWSLRAFTLLDLHVLCSRSDYWAEYCSVIQGQSKALLSMGFNGDLVFDLVPGALDVLQPKIAKISRLLEREVYLRPLSEKRNYWFCQHRFFDATGEGLMDGQLDYENSSNYQISNDDDAERLVVCHGSFGSVERWLWRHLSRAMSAGGRLEEWLCPTQLRLLPVSESAHDYVVEICRSLENQRLRIDVDYSDRSLGRRIKRAFDSFCGAVVVIGDDEVRDKSKPLEVRTADGSVRKMQLSAWVAEHVLRNTPYPFEHSYSGRHLVRNSGAR